MPIQLRQQERTILPTTETGNVKANPDMYAGEFAAQRSMAGAIKEFGGAMADISAKMYQVDVQREQNDFEAKENESQMAMRKFMMDNPDGDFKYDNNGKVVDSKYLQEFNKRQVELANYANSYKTKHGKEFATQRFNANKPIRQYEVDAYSSRDRLDQAAASLDTNIQSIVNNEVDPLKYDFWIKEQEQINPEKAKTLTPDDYKKALISGLLKDHVKTRVVSAENAVAIESKVAGIIQKQEREMLKNNVFANLQGIAQEKGWDEALKLVNDPVYQKTNNLDADSVAELTTKVNQQKSISENLLKQTLEKENNDIGEAIIKGDTGVLDIIKNSHLSYDQKKKWTEEINKKSSHDDEVYNKLLTEVSQNPESVDSEYLASHIAKGINVDDYKELNGILTTLNKQDNYKKIIHNQYVKAINDLQTAKFFNPDDKIGNIQIATKALSALENWSRKNPEATDKDYETFFKTLTMPNIKNYGIRISSEERKEILENTGIDFYEGFDLFGFNINNKKLEEAQTKITEKKHTLLEQDEVKQKTIRMASPDGTKIYDVPENKKQVFIDNGYKVK